MIHSKLYDIAGSYDGALKFPITTCRRCGNRSALDHVAVLGAVGTYCRPCSVRVDAESRRYKDRAISEMMKTGIMRVSVELYDPLKAGE